MESPIYVDVAEVNPRPLPPNLYQERNRHGRVVWYVRCGKGKRIRVRGDFGSAEFARSYQAAILGQEPHWAPRAASNTLGWLIDRYKDSSSWDRLSASTKSQRANIYKVVIGRAGDVPLADVTSKVMRQNVEDRAKTPFGANDFLKAMRALFGWAKRGQYVEADPTEGVKGFPHKTEGFHVWTEEEIARFEAKWAVGTRERLALAILLHTGLRRGDAAMLGRQHIRDGVITLRTAKTGQQVTIPLLPELARIIESTSTGCLALIAIRDGRPMTKESFGHFFREACEAAGVPGRAHGLRKACATRFAEHGATEEELKSWFGWSDGRMASIYTRKANRGRLAQQAARKLIND
jgi:integrase